MTDLQFIANYGSNGSGNTNLNSPFGFDIDGRFIYIADQGNSRIIKWELHGGAYVAQNSDDVTNPRDVYVWKDRLFVVDTGANRIVVMDKDLNLIKAFGSSGSGNTNFNVPLSIAGNGQFIWIADSTNQRIVKYRISNLSFVKKKAVTGLVQQIAHDSHEKTIYQIDASTPKVFKFRESDMVEVDTIVESDSTDSSLTGLEGIGVYGHFLYVTEANRIQVFDTASSTTRDSAGSDGSGNSNIADGNYVKAYKDKIIFSDKSNHRINIWADYKPERGFSSEDTPKVIGGWFTNPFLPIGRQQERQDVTIGGTEKKDLFLNIEEEPPKDNYANVEET